MANVGVKMFSCATCCGCIIASDDYSTDNLAANYTTVAGTWAVAGGELSTSSNNALLILNQANDTNGGVLSISFEVSASGSICRLIGGYQDSNNYVFLELIAGTSIRLWKREGGVDSALNTAVATALLTANTVHTARLCVRGTLVTGTLETASGTVSTSATYTSGGAQAGVGTGGTANTFTVTSLEFAEHSTAEQTCRACGVPCDACEDNTSPWGWQVEITSATGIFECISGQTLIVQRQTACSGSLVVDCFGLNSTITITMAGNPDYDIEITMGVSSSSFPQSCAWGATFTHNGAPWNCIAESQPFSQSYPCFGAGDLSPGDIEGILTAIP